ncbi:glycerophosphodiester phosphodiesterase family protein [uncultured Roseibium sp.]|uniref:glycerophosphodiester phosphodiesterase n=1 Tax=uncultured Roseibium sp. TaxID=1936171 RepID=UPI00260DE6AE|nr:glycerophosphodiester phosphodiesterase family protein [uncultured Roseibium sp.]
MAAFQPGKTWIHRHKGPPLAIAHRGASAYAFDNTLRAFRIAHELGAEMWEVDVRLTADGIPVAFHDEDLSKTCGIRSPVSALSAEELSQLTASVGRPAPRFSDVARLASELGAGIYLDAKEGKAASLAVECLIENRIEKVIVGANTADYCTELVESGCPYPVSILVGLGLDPFAIARDCRAELVHPCWERASERPDRLLDEAFFRIARSMNLPVVTWHEERADVLAELVRMPVLGICSDQPEMVSAPSFETGKTPEIVCHRGACRIAPENTLASARAAWDGGFEYVEVDVRQSADGHLVVHHDEMLDRTTTGSGPLADATLEALRQLDAGVKFDPFFKGEPLPELAGYLDLAAATGRKLYVEIKQADQLAVVGTVLARIPPDDVFFWSFDQELLKTIHRSAPSARLMARPEDYETLNECLSAFDADIIEFNARNANLGDFAAVRAAGRKVMVAYMGSDPNVFSELAQLQPDIFNVNEPFLARRILFEKDKNRNKE